MCKTIMAVAVNRISIADVPEQAHQPRTFSYPKRAFGKTKVVHRSFQPRWFDQWKWIHYDETLDAAFCHPCILAIKGGKVKGRQAEPTFVSTISGLAAIY